MYMFWKLQYTTKRKAKSEQRVRWKGGSERERETEIENFSLCFVHTSGMLIIKLNLLYSCAGGDGTRYFFIRLFDVQFGCSFAVTFDSHQKVPELSHRVSNASPNGISVVCNWIHFALPSCTLFVPLFLDFECNRRMRRAAALLTTQLFMCVIVILSSCVSVQAHPNARWTRSSTHPSTILSPNKNFQSNSVNAISQIHNHNNYYGTWISWIEK